MGKTIQKHKKSFSTWKMHNKKIRMLKMINKIFDFGLEKNNF